MSKYVYSFGGGKTEGTKSMRELLGGKGANLAEMARLDIDVPPGFTISTEACKYYYENDRKLPQGLEEEIRDNLRALEQMLNLKLNLLKLQLRNLTSSVLIQVHPVLG